MGEEVLVSPNGMIGARESSAKRFGEVSLLLSVSGLGRDDRLAHLQAGNTR